MKTLETIQKICKVFAILAKIAMILSFIWAGINCIGVVCCIIWQVVEAIPSGFIGDIVLTQDGDLIKSIGVLLGDFVFGITDGILWFFVTQYLKQELEDGTPFTTSGSKMLTNLGVKTIVIPLIATIIYAIIYACFGLTQYDKAGNGTSVLLGLILLLVALILRHGAELREEKENEHE